MKKAISVFGAGLALLLCSCAGPKLGQLYDGPARGADEIAVLTIPNDFNLIAVDGAKNSGVQFGIQSGPRQFSLLPGTHQLELSYYAIWDINEDDHETVRSSPFAQEFTFEAGAQYTLAFASPPNLGASLQFAGAPRVRLVMLETPMPPKLVATQQPVKTAKRLPSETHAPLDQPPAAESSELMKFWWDKASDAEKADFKAWQKAQDDEK